MNMTARDGALRGAGEGARPDMCGSVEFGRLAAERELLLSVVELASRSDISLSQVIELVCTQLALTLRFERAIVLLVERAGEASHEPAALTLAGGYPSAPHAPTAAETSAACRALSNGTAQASRCDSGSWLIGAPVCGPTGVLGVLVAASSNGKGLSEEGAAVVQAITRQLAQAIARDKRAEEQRVNDQCAAAIRRLLEEGSKARTVHEAGTILAQVAADAFHCERAGMYAVDRDGVISFTVGVGVPPEICDALATALVGKRANDSPAWQRTAQSLVPALVGDSKLVPVRPGGLVETLGFKSYVALPLLSADGHIGYVMCGEVTTPRTWARHDEALARQLALEGALVVDNARLRESERAQLAEMERQAFHDRLTDLPNRALLAERMEEGLTKADTGDAALALLVLDLDDFKQVNDVLGHYYGDLLLQEVSAVLAGLARAGDTVARLGGDEFAILLVGPGPIAGTALAVAERIYQRLREPLRLADLSLQAATSVGIALFPDHGRDATTLLKHADTAMYQAKRKGNGPVVYDPAGDEARVQQLSLFSGPRRNTDRPVAPEPRAQRQPAHGRRRGRRGVA
jgi:diguanylate cyclase (GGDEF)-like protein